MRPRGRDGFRLVVLTSVVLALTALLAIGPATASGATLTNTWQARLGSGGANGTVTLRAFLDGTGSIALKLAKFRAGVTLPITLSKGTCSTVGTTLVRFPALKTTSAGAAARTSTLISGQVTLLLKTTASGGRMAIRVGSATTGGVKCAIFSALAVPAYVAARITISGGPDGPAIGATDAGVFVLGWADGGTASRLNPATNTLTPFALQTNSDEGPDSIASGEGSLWVTTEGPTGDAPWAVQRLDSATGDVVRIPVDGTCGLTTSPGAVWVGAGRLGTISRIDPETNQVVATIRTGMNACDPQFALGFVWAASDEAGMIWRIDPATNNVAASLRAALGPDDYFTLLLAFDSAWAIDDEGDLLRVDPATMTVAATIADVGSPTDVDSGAGSVWVADWGTDGQPDGALSRIDPATNTVIATIPVGMNPGPILFAGGYVWVALQGEPVVVQVNPATNRVQSRLGVGGIPGDLVATEHAVWVTVPGEETDDDTPTAESYLVRINY